MDNDVHGRDFTLLHYSNSSLRSLTRLSLLDSLPFHSNSLRSSQSELQETKVDESMKVVEDGEKTLLKRQT